VVECDGSQCDLSAKVCCQKNEGGGNWGGSCLQKNQGCVGTAVACDGPEDCAAGTVCCGKVGSNAFTSLACTPEATCQYTSGYRVICGSSGVCPTGYVCKPSSAPTDYFYCGVPPN